MKLIDFLTFEPLNELRRQMGANKLGTFSPVVSDKRLSPEELESLITFGIDVPVNAIRVLQDGTLAYKDSRVLVYIRDVSLGSGTEETIANMPRFHLANCRTLQEMKLKNRWQRYVVAIRDDGYFSVNKIYRGGKSETDLLALIVCQNCLDFLKFDDFSLDRPKRARHAYARSFSIKRFFEQFPRSLFAQKPDHDAITAPINDYPLNFPEISARTKRDKQFRCENCGRSFAAPGDERFLHVHHLNGAKYDSRIENLKVLCLGCHANEPMHGHMKRLPEYQEFIRRFGRPAK